MGGFLNCSDQTNGSVVKIDIEFAFVVLPGGSGSNLYNPCVICIGLAAPAGSGLAEACFSAYYCVVRVNINIINNE